MQDYESVTSKEVYDFSFYEGVIMLKTIAKIILSPIFIFLWLYGCSLKETETETNLHKVPRAYPSCDGNNIDFFHSTSSISGSSYTAALSDCKEIRESEGYDLEITFKTGPKDGGYKFSSYVDVDWQSFLELDDKATIEVSTSWPKFKTEFESISNDRSCPIVESDDSQKKWTFHHSCHSSVIKNYEDKFKENSITSSDRYEVSK